MNLDGLAAIAPGLLGRLAAAVLIIGAGLLAFHVVNTRLLRRRTSAETARGLEGLRPGIPAILYFTTPDCAPCRTVQRPALARLKSQLDGGLQIVEVDCTQRPELADYWGVLSVPTTFIIDRLGRPRHVNHGATSAEKLLAQLDNFR